MICARLVISCLLVTTAVHADNLPREFTITPVAIKDAPAFMTTVVVPDANCAAVSDAAGILVVGQRAKDEKTKYEKHLAVFRLGADGQPVGEPSWVALPRPAVLAENVNYPLGLLFHPRLPLLYVWQDVNGPPSNKQEKNPEFANYLEFEHLIVYSIKDGVLEQVAATASGAGFHCGLSGGMIGFDFGAKHLYVPNAIGATYDEGGIAYYALDEEGLPGDAPEVKNEKPNQKVLVEVGDAKKPGSKLKKAMVLPKSTRTHRYYPTGAGWFAGSGAMLMGGYSGCMIADFNNGSMRQTWFTLPDLTGPCTLTGHPTLPAVYLCLQDHNHLYAIAQANGYLTLLPQVATVLGAHMTGTPVVLTKQSRLAIGDTKSLHLIGLRGDGKLDGTDERLTLPCAVAKGIAYSEKHGRLYVAVDKPN